MEAITLNMVLPEVFSGMEKVKPVCDSQVWLRNLTLSRGTRVLIEAASGTGKTSLCAFIYGVRADYRGSILFDGEDIAAFDTTRWCAVRRSQLAWMPQEMALFPELSVMENLLIKNRLTDRYSEPELRAMLERLEVDNKAASPAGILSLGQQQRVAAVRALAQPFDFILLDEPVSHLDAAASAALGALVGECAAAEGAAVVATSVGNNLPMSDPEIIRL